MLEQQFCDLIPSDTLIDQFEDFLAVKYGHIKSLNEVQFTDHMINVPSHGVYDELIQ